MYGEFIPTMAPTSSLPTRSDKTFSNYFSQNNTKNRSTLFSTIAEYNGTSFLHSLQTSVESTVKSFKHHLKRVSNGLFTYEELNTFIIQVESILSLQPITTILTFPNDLQALTLGYFLIGRPLTELPEHDSSNNPANFFLGNTYQRSSATSGHDGTKRTLMILTFAINRPRNNGSSDQWVSVTETYPGPDIICIVDVKISTDSYKRNVQKLIPLPMLNLLSRTAR